MLITIGKIARPHGMKGELLVIPETFDPSRFERLKKIYVAFPGEILEHQITSVSIQNQGILIKFAGIENMTQAELLKNGLLQIQEQDMIHPSGDEYLISDLQDMEVKLGSETIGRITEIQENAAYPLLRVGDEHDFIFIPFLKSFIAKVDLTGRVIYLDTKTEELLKLFDDH
ncbi:MAG: ribosome maturation factor RimM [Candidatus Wallbacteria bacterium]|nr:ribosome maturation factor RimM [Candidatus Wallbacteria bacterium]